MKVLRFDSPEFEAQVRELSAASSLFDPAIEKRTREIIEAVRQRGDRALIECAERFDGARLTADQLGLSKAELLGASVSADDTLRAAVQAALKNIRYFSRRSLRKNWTGRNSHGAQVGEKYDPFRRVGIYVPGGKAPLMSTALMSVALAKVAGCPEIVVCTPCNAQGAVNPALLYAACAAGATEIYRVGGAQAVAALALGTETIRPVQKVFGPGNAYVVAAKRLLFGYVAVDLLPGPSEVLVLADDSAAPKHIAVDLLAQAEHGSGHERVWFVTPSARLIRQVGKEITRQLPQCSRRELIQRVLDTNTWFIQVQSLEQAVAVANQLAPEHCEVITRQPARIAAKIVTAGALLLGPWSPAVLGDYVAGPSHVLPTGGAGASFAGLTVDQFQRRTSVVAYSRAALGRARKPLLKFAEVEGLDAHGRSASIRLGK